MNRRRDVLAVVARTVLPGAARAEEQRGAALFADHPAALLATTVPKGNGAETGQAPSGGDRQIEGADAGLLKLGSLLDEAAAIEAGAWAAAAATGSPGQQSRLWDIAQAANARTGAIVAQVERLAATTLEGLHVKSRALTWCMAGDKLFAEELSGHARPTTDMRLVAAIVADLQAMGVRA